MIAGLKVNRINGKIISKNNKKFLLRLLIYDGYERFFTNNICTFSPLLLIIQ